MVKTILEHRSVTRSNNDKPATKSGAFGTRWNSVQGLAASARLSATGYPGTVRMKN